MKIIWLSHYRTFSLSTRYGIFLLTSLMIVAVIIGFFGGVSYHQSHMIQSEGLNPQATAQQKIQALTNILAEMQAKFVTLESMQKNISSSVPPEKTTRLNLSLAPSDGRGGPFIPKEITSILNGNKKNLDELLHDSQVSLSKVNQLETLLLKSGHAQLQDQSELQFKPSLVPVNSGRLVSRFGVRRDPFNFSSAMHEGLDFAAPIGTPIYAAASGIVTKVRHGGDYGLYTIISHENHYETLYAHASRIFIKEGQLVQKGQLIAEVGSTGRATGPHLHFEILQHGRQIDPESILNLSYFQETQE